MRKRFERDNSSWPLCDERPPSAPGARGAPAALPLTPPPKAAGGVEWRTPLPAELERWRDVGSTWPETAQRPGT